MISGRIAAGIALLSVLFSGSTAPAADKAEKTAPEAEVGQFSFRRTAREYGGRVVEGEDRVIARGDSVWRMLVKEKGVPEKQFSQYLVVIRGLNPQLKNLNALKIGDTIFIPLRPEELLGPQPVAAQKPVAARPPLERGTTRNYRVRAGDHLYQILREQLGIQSERELASHYALVKDLNPEKKNWDVLIEGETIRLPLPPQDRATRGARQEVASAEPRGREARRAEPAPAVRIGPD
ncbi:MAG TPA: hypothetical protein VNO43_00140, partial [Candidatus Eisenbacteria bacterium]|nr:hypothetical protein [Candidatus Eisenbacteria bacterium]